MGKKLTSEEFISICKSKHGDKYDYSVMEYKNSSNKIKIICPKHGVFEQLASNHRQGKGCLTCGVISRKQKQSSTTIKFINKANKTHGYKYDYSLVKYKNNSTKVNIICSEHGVFNVTPNSHISKRSGCMACYINKMRLGLDEFVRLSSLVHDNKYQYHLVNYLNSRTKVKIICPKHGEFTQSPHSHLKGHGCSSCNTSKGELIIKKFLDENGVKYIRQYKFSDCKNKKPLSFDFFLPHFNTCVEYDGIQHFKPYGWDKSGSRFKSTQKNDGIKNEYCLKNGIKLVRIKYNDKINLKNILE